MPAAKIYELSAASDPRDALLKSAGDLTNVELMSGRVLVGIYIAPEKTAGGIIRPNSNVKEDVWQGAVGLVLKKGKLAFKDDATTKFHDQNANVGDWVLFNPGDGRRVQIRGVDCRIIEDTLIQAVLDDPSIVTHDK